MLRRFRDQWRAGHIRPYLLCLIFLVSACFILYTAFVHAQGADSDQDGISDTFELFFGLNPTNSADAGLDYDSDHLSNLQESSQLTDPFAPDTDRDGFPDDADANPISRAYIQWGAPQFTVGNQYDYAHPDWFLNASKNGGEWLSLSATQSAWHVAFTESNDEGRLSVSLDRSLLTNDLRYLLHYYDHTNSSLYLDLLDTNAEAVVAHLYGNLNQGSNAEATVCLAIPLTNYPAAAIIQLHRGTGESTVYEGLLYIDEDGDGLDREMEAQLGTSDHNADSDGDGLLDYDEVFIYGTNHI